MVAFEPSIECPEGSDEALTESAWAASTRASNVRFGDRIKPSLTTGMGQERTADTFRDTPDESSLGAPDAYRAKIRIAAEAAGPKGRQQAAFRAVDQNCTVISLRE